MEYYDDFYDGLKDTRNMLYRQIDTVAILNKLSSTLCSEIHNLKNYNLNVIGDSNYIIKDFTEKVITILEKYDNKIKTLIKIKNGFPILQLGDIETISLIKTLPSMDYKGATISVNMNKEFKIINNLIEEAISSALKENDYQTITILSKMQYKLSSAILDIPQI